MRHNILYILAVALMATSCIYDFSAELGSSDRRVVIEGDLMLGQNSTVALSYVTSIGKPENRLPQKNGSVWVLAEDGKRYDGQPSNEAGKFNVDLTQAPSGTRYQLHVINGDSGKEYATGWLTPNKAAVIDDLSYIPEPNKNRMAIGISLHSDGAKYFRWNYDEIWEYTSTYQARYYYTPVENLSQKEKEIYPNGRMDQFRNGENTYYCWERRKSGEILIFSTKEQTEDRFVDLEFRTIPRSDARLSIMYYMKVYVCTMSEDAYYYWNNIQSNSDYNGSLFAPNPSEMSGNVRCVDSPDEQVLGYVDVSETAVAELFIDNQETNFYVDTRRNNYEPETCESSDLWPALYKQGKLPIELVSDMPAQYSWVAKSCVDCRELGGTKDKPDFWPNLHK